MIVLDTNILISALIRDSTTRKLLVESGLEFAYPEHVFIELEKYTPYIIKKTDYTRQEYSDLLNRILDYLNLVPLQVIKPFLPKAKHIMQKIDPKDIAFVATALALKCPIWTDDKDFEQQKIVKILKTKDMIRYLRRI